MNKYKKNRNSFLTLSFNNNRQDTIAFAHWMFLSRGYSLSTVWSKNNSYENYSAGFTKYKFVSTRYY